MVEDSEEEEKMFKEVVVKDGVEVSVEVIEEWVGDVIVLEMVIEEVDLLDLEVTRCQGKWKYDNELK